ncbi:MAG: Trk system potassium transporter TrkA [Clostridia bacterium]|nr:Trk system potassium transporter TrkA [Clostridia bacterium]MDD4680046.1 Trk system potassium transporter TrkA [Clostridia bacterium]
MKIIIIGGGKVGYNLAENLSREDNDITIIDKNADALKKADEYLDVMCIKGNGLSTRVLTEAGVKEADLLIAVTNSDEMNMVCCLTSKKLGVDHTIARIRDPEYAEELSQLKEDLSLDMVINPEQAVAAEISRLLEFPPAMDVEMFSKGRVEMVEMMVTREMSIVNMNLKDIAKRFSSEILIGGVFRNDDVIVPKGNTIIQEKDTIYIVGRPSEVFHFCTKIGIHVQKIKNAMIMGGGRIAYYLAKYLDDMGIKIKIIEIDRKRCMELTELLNNVLVINGDGSEENVLLSENLSEMGAFVSVTGRDEDNLMAALLAKLYGVKKVVAKINRTSYSGVIKNLGLDNVVSPKLITANYILRYVRGLQNAMGNPVNSLYRIMNNKAEAIEFTANQFTKILDTPLSKLNIMAGILVAAIVRKHKIIIPHGNDVIKAGDNVILIAKEKKLIDLNDIVV